MNRKAILLPLISFNSGNSIARWREVLGMSKLTKWLMAVANVPLGGALVLWAASVTEGIVASLIRNGISSAGDMAVDAVVVAIAVVLALSGFNFMVSAIELINHLRGANSNDRN